MATGQGQACGKDDQCKCLFHMFPNLMLEVNRANTARKGFGPRRFFGIYRLHAGISLRWRNAGKFTQRIRDRNFGHVGKFAGILLHDERSLVRWLGQVTVI